MNTYSPAWLRVTRTEAKWYRSTDRRLVIPTLIGIIAVIVTAAFLGATY